MKVLKNKKNLIIFVFILIIITSLTISLISINKQPTKVTTIEKIEVLKEGNSANAAELIKRNIVKITNNIENNTITGTGFFHETGYLITNSHIVDIKGNIIIEYSNGIKEEATLVSNDIISDIAILSVKKGQALAMTFGDTLSLNVTDEVYAVGYPYGLEGEATVTKGILSARRSAGGIEYLQTDMALNSGNSGGPLINDRAEVFGMTTYATENASIGMSISAENLENIINKLINNKQINYLEDVRKENALNIVLKEIGHHDDDIYNQKHIINKFKKENKPKEEKHEQQEELNKEITQTPNDLVPSKPSDIPKKEEIEEPPKSSDATLKSFSVSGYELKNYVYNQRTKYLVVRNPNLDSLNITVVPNDLKATYTIEGNSNFKEGIINDIKINVKAEDGITNLDYHIYLIKPLSKIPNLLRIMPELDKDYNPNLNDTVYRIRPEFYNKDGALLSFNEYIGIIDYYKIDIYQGFFYFDQEGEYRLLKSYTIKATEVDKGPPEIEHFMPVIKLSDVRAMLTDEDYKEEGNNAKYSINVTLVTYDGLKFNNYVGQTLTK